MKIQENHFNFLLEKMAPFAPKIAAHREFLIKENKAKDLEMRLRWDIFYAAGLSSFAADTLYKAGLNDDHIDSALKKIMKLIEK